MPLLELPFARLRRRWRASTRTRDQVDPTRVSPPLPVEAGVWFGTATVVAEAPDGGVTLRLHDDLARTLVARWALPYRYRPVRGDTVWVAAEDGRAYVLAILRGTGQSELLFQGDTTWSARGGTLRLVAGRSLRVVGAALTLRARTLELVAGAVHTHARRWTERVAGLRTLRAGAVFRQTDGIESVTAREIAVRARDVVKFDGGDVVAIS